MATPIPANTASFSLRQLVELTGGAPSGPRDVSCVGVTGDSRCVRPGNLFVALSGDRFDGHCFVEQAIAAGAAALLVEQPVVVPAHVACCRVPSTLSALGELGRMHRRRSQALVIAVAGSAGKTTTKNAIGAGLEAIAPGQVHASPGNLNNAIGVPFSLLGLTARHRFAVVEVGTNRLGEVEQLARLVEPDVGVLTLVGLEHSEGLGGLDSIEQEEGALLGRVPADGTLVFNADDARVARQAARAPAARKLSYGRATGASYQLVERTLDGLVGATLTIRRPDGSELEVSTPLLGEAGALATLAALTTTEFCAGRAVDPMAFAASLRAKLESDTGRLSVIELADGSVLVDDSYNSNPASARSSLAVARELAAGRGTRLVAVLGEMRELGSFADREHEKLGAELPGFDVAELVAIAGSARLLHEAASARGVRGQFVQDSPTGLLALLGRVRAGDVVLVKASRGVRAEQVARGLVSAKGRAA